MKIIFHKIFEKQYKKFPDKMRQKVKESKRKEHFV